MGEPSPQIYEFGPFRLDAQRRLLLRDGTVVKLAPKVFETLLALVEGRGRVLDKAELMRRLWPNSFVEEGNLTLHISTLRKALGETLDQHRYVVTVPGQGYRFVADVTPVAPEPPEQKGPPADEVADAAAVGHGASQATGPPAEAAAPATAAATRNRRSFVGAAFALVFVAAAGGFWLYRFSPRDVDSPATAAATPTQPLTFRRFAAHGGVPIRVAISRDGKTLVYQQRINGRDSLWLGQTDTDTSVPISQGTGLTYGEPAFAPDGSSLYFTVSGDTDREPTLVRMPVLGGVMTELVPNVHSPVTFSPDGAQVAFVRRDDAARQTSVVIVNAVDGRHPRTLISRTWPEDVSTRGLAWSPDGRTIAVGTSAGDGQEEIAAITVADGSVRALGARAWGLTGNLAWLPDGTGLVLLARLNRVARKSYIWLVPFPAGDARRVTNDLNLYLANSLSLSGDGTLAVLQGFIHSAVWLAPEGDATRARRVLQGVAPRYEGVDGLTWTVDGRLLYTAYTGDNLSIWSMNRDGGDLRRLTGSGPSIVDSRVCATADGRFIVFHSNRSGALEIWRANADGTGLKPLTTGGGNSLPSVTPDSRWVVYTSTRSGESTLWRVPIDGGTAVQLTDQSSSWAQVSPDGTRIAYTADAPDARLTIMPFGVPVERGAPVQSFIVPRTALVGRRVMRWTSDGTAIVYKDDLRGLWRQRLGDDKPEPVRGFEDLLFHHLAWSFDGKDLAYTSGPTTQEIILIDHVR